MWRAGAMCRMKPDMIDSRITWGLLLAVVLAGCETTEPEGSATPESSAAARPEKVARAARANRLPEPKWRTEPVIFNGRRYALAFRPAGKGRHVVRLSAPGRKLGGGKGDAKVVRELATASMHHFTCRDSQKAHIEKGTLRHANGKWLMTVRCR